jgi:hypothetical protein
MHSPNAGNCKGEQEETMSAKMLKGNEVVVVGRKQQLSKILMGQLKAEIKRTADNNIKELKAVNDTEDFCPTEYHFMHDTLRDFGTDGTFEFTIQKMYGMRKLSYINQNGLISAIFSLEEWNMMQKMIGHFYVSELNRANREVSWALKEQEMKDFDAKVAAEVARQLRVYEATHKCSRKTVYKGRPSSVTDPGYKPFTEMAEKQDVDDDKLY